MSARDVAVSGCDSGGLLKARNVVLGHDVRIARRYATPAGGIRIHRARNPIRIECRAAGRRRFPRRYHRDLTRLVWLSFRPS